MAAVEGRALLLRTEPDYAKFPCIYLVLNEGLQRDGQIGCAEMGHIRCGLRPLFQSSSHAIITQGCAAPLKEITLCCRRGGELSAVPDTCI